MSNTTQSITLANLSDVNALDDKISQIERDINSKAIITIVKESNSNNLSNEFLITGGEPIDYYSSSFSIIRFVNDSLLYDVVIINLHNIIPAEMVRERPSHVPVLQGLPNMHGTQAFYGCLHSNNPGQSCSCYISGQNDSIQNSAMLYANFDELSNLETDGKGYLYGQIVYLAEHLDLHERNGE